MENKNKQQFFPNLQRTSLQKQIITQSRSFHNNQDRSESLFENNLVQRIHSKKQSLKISNSLALNETRMRFSFRKDLNMTKSNASCLREMENLQKLRHIDSQKKKINRILEIEYSHTRYKQKNKKNRISLQLFDTNFVEQSVYERIDPIMKTDDSPEINAAHKQTTFYSEASLCRLQNICYDSQFSYKRQGDCMTVINDKIYLMGGFIRRKFFFPKQQHRHKQLMLHYYQQNLWHQQTLLSKSFPRFQNLVGHTVQKLNKNVIAIILGMSGDSVKTLQEYNSSIITFNVQKQQFGSINCDLKIRSHASTHYENYLLIHGGIDHQRKYLKQLHVVCFLGENSPKIITIPTCQELANHKIVTTLGMDISSRISLKQNDGIFLFGGQNSQKKMTNALKILRLSPTNLQNERKLAKKFERIFTKGQKPCSRIHHSMNLLASKNKIVIIGGSDAQGNLLSDIWIFDLIFSQWIRYNCNPNIKELLGGISKHATAVNMSSIYIFGGQHSIDPGCSNFFILELQNSKKLNEHKINKENKSNEKVNSFWSLSTTKNIVQSTDKFIGLDY